MSADCEVITCGPVTLVRGVAVAASRTGKLSLKPPGASWMRPETARWIIEHVDDLLAALEYVEALQVMPVNGEETK